MNQQSRKYKLTLIALMLGVILILSGAGGTAVVKASDPIIVGCSNGVGNVDALIAAFVQANKDAGVDTISLGENCTYTLLTPDNTADPTGLPGLESDLVLEGNGAVIERDPQAPAFRLLAVDPNYHLTINNLTLRGGSHPTSGGAIAANLGSFLTLSGAILENNNAKQGGGIYTQGETIIRDSHLLNNVAADMGGGIYAAATLTIERSELFENGAEAGGGGIYAAMETAVHDSRFTANYTNHNNEIVLGNGGGIQSSGVLTVTGSHFAYNEAQNGGAIDSSNIQITGSTFYRNYASQYAGGVYTSNASRGIHEVHFEQNRSANGGGGGLFVSGDLDLQRSYFHRNESGLSGGGLYIFNSGPTALIANNLWVDNTSATQVGNAMGLAVMSSASKPFHVRHNTVVNTGPTQPGSGIFITNSYAIFVNNILTGFETAIDDQSAKAFTSSNLYFNNGTNEKGMAAAPEKALVADPKFAGEGNYRLGEGSPAIDSAAVTSTPIDILGTGRSLGSGPDRGAYEFNGETEKIYPVTCASGVEGLAGAITAANKHFGPDVIEIEDAGCVFELTTSAGTFGYDGQVGLPAVIDTLRLDGGGTTVQRKESASPFRILDNYAPNLTIQNLTIRNGFTDEYVGGGIYAEFGANLHLIGVKLRDNKAAKSGGGLYSSGAVTAENSEVIDNWTGASGGGLFVNNDLTLSHSIVTGNESIDGNGGGIHVVLNGEISNSLIANNQTFGSGGGIFAYAGLDLRSTTLINNQAGENGGGLYVHLPYQAATLVNNVWLKNQADGKGTAISIRDSNSNGHEIFHNTIVGDGTPERAAIYMFGYGMNPPSLRVENNIIVAPNSLGVLKEGQGTLATRANLYFNNALNEVGATTSSDHVKADPLFRNLNGNDVRLRKGSPAIDSANDLGVAVDHNGVSRPQGSGYDIGAYEYTTNTPPTAAADNFSTLQETALAIPDPGLLANDQDDDGDPLAAVLQNQPAHGVLALDSNGSFTYTPETGFSGSDSFSYRADDYDDQSQPAKVTIEVLPAGTNLPPVAVADSYWTNVDTALAIFAPGVLGNDKDANGDPLTAVLESQPAHGTLTFNANGSFTYSPNPGFNGNDSFSYRAKDSIELSEPAAVTIRVMAQGEKFQSVLLPLVIKP